MVYKRYIKKNGKVYGPYIYHNKKKDGKVISTYLGKSVEVPRKQNLVNNFLKKSFLILIVIGFAIFFTNYANNLTGNVAININEDYQFGDLINGTLKLLLKHGEFLPINQSLVIDYDGERFSYPLADLVNLESSFGDFYIEGEGVIGSGSGFGIPGEKISYPDVSFAFRIIDLEDEEETGEVSRDISKPSRSEGNSELDGNEEVVEEIEEEEIEEGEDEPEVEEVEVAPLGVLQNTELDGNEEVEEVEEENEESMEEPIEEVEEIAEEDEEETEGSGSSMTGLAISSNELFGHVSYDSYFIYDLEDGQGVLLISSEEEIDFEVVDNQLIVKTNYSDKEFGFGEEFLTDYKTEFLINLSKLNLPAKEGELIISLNYLNETFATESIFISVSGPEIKELVLVNNELLNATLFDLNETLNLTNKTINETIGNLSIETIQSSVVLGKPVKWKKKVVTDVIAKIEVEIPVEATNISISEIVGGIELNLEDNIKLEGQGKTRRSFITAEVISGKVSLEFEEKRDFNLKIFFKNIFNAFTGKVISIESDSVNTIIIVEENSTSFEITYETPGPISFEKNLSFGKEIIISDPNELGYENVLAFTYLESSVVEEAIRLYHLENGSRVMTDFISYDLDNDSLIDYIEWIVPHLSNQSYELEIIDLSNIFYAPLDNTTASYAIIDNTNNSITDGSKFNKDEFLTFKHKDYGKRFRIKGLFASNNVSLQNLIIRTNNYQTVIDARDIFGVDLIHTIYVPNTVNSGVYVCPNAYTLEGVNSSCSEKIMFSYAEANSGTWKSGIHVVVENDSYKISNLTGSGGSEYTPSCGDSITVDTTLAAGLTDCAVHGLSIGAHNIVLDCQGHTIDGDISSSDRGISLNNYNNVVVKNCVITEFDYGMLSWWDATNQHIYNNTIYNITERGILISDSNAYGVDNNIIENNTIYDIASYGIFLNDVDGTIVHNNTIYDSSFGIFYETDAANTIISNNTIYDNTGDGIHLRGNDNNVTGNKIYNNSNEGIHIYESAAYNNIISSNEVYENYDYNIYISNGASSNIVKDNNIHSSDSDGGIYVNHIDTINNQLINNSVYDNLDEGIAIGTWSSVPGGNNSVVNNTIYGNGLRGIFVTAENSTIHGNNVYGNSGYGIYIYKTANYANVTNNYVHNGLSRGIESQEVQNISVTNNYVFNNSLHGFFLYKTNNSLFRNNTLTDNFKSSYGGNVELFVFSFNIFEDNKIIGGSDFGLRIYINVNNNIIRNNLVANSSDDLLKLGDSSHGDCDNNTFINNTFESNGSFNFLAMINYANNNEFIDNTFTGSGTHFYFGNDGNNTIFLNTTFDSLAWETSGIHDVYVKWYLDIKVNTSDGDLENANVTVYDNAPTEIFSELTNSSGWISRYNLTEYMYDGSTYTYFTNYTLNTTSPSESYGNNSREIDLTSSTIEYITLGAAEENDPPNDPTSLLTSVDGLNLTSSDLNCSSTISDPNSDLLNVSVRWYKNHALNLTMDYNNSYASGTLFNATLGSGNTTFGEIWNCSLKLNDGEFDSSWGVSNELNIVDTVAPIISWEDPTPPNGEDINFSFAYLNASIVDGAFVSTFFDFNESLVGYWNFENYNATGIYDNSSHDNFLLFSGSVGASSLVDSIYGEGMYFDGGNDKLQKDWDASFDKPTDGLTMSFWLKHEPMPNWDLKLLLARAYRTVWVNPYFEYGTSSHGVNSTHFEIGSRVDGVGHSYSNPITYDEWHHLVITWNGSSQDVIYYIDGVASSTDNQGVTEMTYQYNGPFIVGLNLANNEDLNGSIDEIAIFSRTLGIDEIGEIYQNSDYSLEKNFTNLDFGNYTYSAYAIDLSGNSKMTSSRFFNFEDSTPTINSVAITNSVSYTNDTIVCEYNVTGDGTINANLSFFVDGVKTINETNVSVVSGVNGTYNLTHNYTHHNDSIICVLDVWNVFNSSQANASRTISIYPTNIALDRDLENTTIGNNVTFYSNYSSSKIGDIGALIYDTGALSADAEAVEFFDCQSSGDSNCLVVGTLGAAYEINIYNFTDDLISQFGQGSNREIISLDSNDDGYNNEIISTSSTNPSLELYNLTENIAGESSSLNYAYTFAVGDLDSDSIDEVIAGDSVGGIGLFYKNNLTEKWYVSVASSNFLEIHIIDDLNSDGIKDIIGVVQSGAVFAVNGSNGGIIWNTSDLDSYGVVILDLDNDGERDELVIGMGSSEGRELQSRNSTGGILWTTDLFTEGYGRDFIAGDFDSDGYFDDFIVTAVDENLAMYNANETGVYENWTTIFESTNRFDTIILEDVNDDGIKEILGGGDDGTIGIYDLSGNELFSYVVGGSISDYPGLGIGSSIANGDFNLDGIDDVAVASDDHHGYVVQTVTCNISFSDGNFSLMDWNESTGRWEYTRDFDVKGVYAYNIICNKAGYEEMNDNDKITILNTLPTVTLLTPANFATITNRTPQFTWNGVDLDSDDLQYQLNITCNSCSIDDRWHSIKSDSYNIINYFQYLSDNGYSYNWTVRATDDAGSTWGVWADSFTYDVQAEVSISLPVNSIDFDNLFVGESKNTSGDAPPPLVLQNDGNVLINISMNASDLWDSIFNPNEYYQYKIDYNELGSFDYSSSVTTFTNISDILSFSLADLNWSDSNDSAEVDIKIEVPLEEFSGDKNSLIVFTSSLSE